MCTSQGLFQTFAVPAGDYDFESGKYKIDITVGYIVLNTGSLSTETAGRRNAIGFDVQLNGQSGDKLAPLNDNGRHYSVLSKAPFTGAKSDFLIPFALPCNAPVVANKQYKVTIYDADAGDMFGFINAEVYIKNTNTRVVLSDRDNGTFNASNTLFTVDQNATNKETSSFNMTMQANTQYVLRISKITNGNTIDIGLPDSTGAIHGVIPCNPPVTGTNEYVRILPSIRGGSSLLEPGELTTADGSAYVNGFPSLYQKEWPYDEVAIQNANAANIAPNREDYDAQSAGATGDSAEIRVMCGGGTYRFESACSTFRCADGTSTADNTQFCGSRGGRQWKCDWTNPNNNVALPPKYPAPSTNPPGCAIVQYQCKNVNEDWVNSYKHWANEAANGCNNRWNCPDPSGTANMFGPQPSGNVCKLFYCQVPTDSGQPFYDGNGGQNSRCDFRCSAGSGAHALLAQVGSNGKWGDGDMNCYYEPSFSIICRMFDGVNTFDVPDTVRSTSTEVCRAAMSLVAPARGVQVCQSVTVIQPTNGAIWGDPGRPGKALSQTWRFEVYPPAVSCITSVAKPTFKVFGGDVATGLTFNSDTCENDDFNSSSIAAWPGMSTGYNGSYTEYAAYAPGSIIGFGTSKKQGTNVPRGLAFANTIGSGEWFGGSYGLMPCITNHAGLKPPVITSVNSLNSTPDSGSYQLSTNNIANSPTINKSKKYTLYKDGDLRISSNILYDRNPATPWSSTDEIPALKIVVIGNIYIEAGVSELNGVYVAQPDASGNGGHIFTCADVAEINLNDSCNNPLTVNGAFIAKRVILNRTSGTQREGTTAEIFRYLPELWLTEWPNPPAIDSMRYDSMTNLAPIL